MSGAPGPRAALTGRRSKLTPATQDRICQYLKAGNTFKAACQLAGIGVQTGAEWRARGEGRDKDRPANGNAAFAAFAAAVQTAEDEAVARNIAVIQKAALNGTWQAAAWWLERKFPHDWGRIDRTEISGPAGKPIAIEDSRERLAGKIAAIADRRRAAGSA